LQRGNQFEKKAWLAPALGSGSNYHPATLKQGPPSSIFALRLLPADFYSSLPSPDFSFFINQPA
jgi:hypothetical protein